MLLKPKYYLLLHFAIFLSALLGELKAKNSVSKEGIKEAILKHPGPFVTPKRIYHRFSSRTRPDGAAVHRQIVKL